jgi:hypothetical protein
MPKRGCQLHPLKRFNVPGNSFPIHCSTDNATGITGTFTTGIQIFHLRVMKGIIIPRYANR